MGTFDSPLSVPPRLRQSVPAGALLDALINPATISMLTVRSGARIVADDCKFHL